MRKTMAPRFKVLCHGGLLFCATSTTLAFHNPAISHLSPAQIRSTVVHNALDLSEETNRDMDSMHEWACSYGVQQAEGFQLTSYDGYDFFAMAGTDIPAGTCILYVP